MVIQGLQVPNEWTSLRKDRLHLYNNVQTPWFLYLFTFLTALGGFLFGYDTGVISGAIILIRQDFKLSTGWQEMVVASTIGAAALFALVGGYIGDKVGRKPVILLGSVIFTSGSLCMGCAEDKYMLVLGRVVVGMAIGLSSMTVPMYIAESAPAEIRGRLVSVNIVMVAGGQFVANIIAGLFSFTDNGWRYMLGLGAIPSVVQFIAFLFMPESPRWLIIMNRHDEAREVLSKLRGDSANIDEEYKTISRSILTVLDEIKQREHKHLIIKILQTPSVYRALIVGCGLQIIQQLAGINTVMYYSATIITMAGIRNARAAIWLSALTSSVNFLFTLVGIYLVEKLGRRPLAIISLVGAIISLACLGTGFQLESIYSPPITIKGDLNSTCSKYSFCDGCRMDIRCGFCYFDSQDNGIRNSSCLPTSPDDWLHSLEGWCESSNTRIKENKDKDLVWAYDFCPTEYYWLPMVGLALYLAFFAPGMGPVPWTINAEIYPLWARGAANGASTFTNWLFNLFCSISFLSLTEAIGAHGTFWMYLSFSIVGLVFLIMTLPETKGKNLEEIEGMFASSWINHEGKFQPYKNKDSVINYVHMANQSIPTSDTKASEMNDYRNSLSNDTLSTFKSELINPRLCSSGSMTTSTDSEDESE